ncbi:MAG TPA: TadE/TadG family type IV pilus assembly protein [Ktedonobacterales bacterium]
MHEVKVDGMTSLYFRQRLARSQYTEQENCWDKGSLFQFIENTSACLCQRRKRHHSAGQGLVELAIILPTLLLIMMGAIDLGRVFYAYTAIGNAAYQAARQSARGGYLFTACKSTDEVSCDAIEMTQQLCPATDTTYQTDAQTNQTSGQDYYKVIDIYSLLRCELGALFRDYVTDPSSCKTAQVPNPTLAFPVIATPNALTPPIGDGCIGWGYNLATDAGGAQEVTVTVTYNFSFITPLLLLLNGSTNYLTIRRVVSVAVLTGPNSQPYP